MRLQIRLSGFPVVQTELSVEFPVDIRNEIMVSRFRVILSCRCPWGPARKPGPPAGTYRINGLLDAGAEPRTLPSGTRTEYYGRFPIPEESHCPPANPAGG